MKTMLYNGEKYIVKKCKHRNGNDTLFLAKLDEKKYDSIVSDIVKAVKGAVDPEEAVRQALASLEWDEIVKMHKQIKNKAKVRAEKGCYNLVIGTGKTKQYIPMVD